MTSYTFPMSRIALNVLSCAMTIALAGCASSPHPPAGSEGGAKPASPVSEKAVTQAALTPLNDLNLVRADIPEVLRAAAREPYAEPADRSCAGIATAVQALDAVLGADLDTPPSANNPSLIERGSDAAGNAAVGALRSTAEGAIPFRGWVRKLTGAERYSREVAAAIAAGTVRRAYLKGIGLASSCEAPAGPRRPAKP